MSILILGGNRFMGRYLSTQLAAAGKAPVLFNRGNLPAPRDVETILGDRSAPDGLAALAGRDFEAVIDLSAYKADWVETAVSTLGARVGHYVFVSSGAVYRPRQDLPWTEDSPLGPDPAWGNYGREKLRAESLLSGLAKSGTTVTIVRPPFVLGPENYADREAFIFSRLIAQRPILLPGGGRSINQYVHAADVAAAIVALLGRSRDALAAYNVGLRSAISNRGLVELCASIAGVTAQVIEIDATALGVASAEIDLANVVFPFPDAHYFLDCAKLERDTGVRATHSLESTLREFFESSGRGARLKVKEYDRETRVLEQLKRAVA